MEVSKHTPRWPSGLFFSQDMAYVFVMICEILYIFMSMQSSSTLAPITLNFSGNLKGNLHVVLLLKWIFCEVYYKEPDS